MKAALSIWFLLIGLLCSGTGQALESFDWEDLQAVERQYWDDPREVRALAEATLPTLNPDRDPRLWVHVFHTLASLTDDLQNIPHFAELNQKARIVAQQLGLDEILVDFVMFEGNYLESLSSDAQAALAKKGRTARNAYDEALHLATQKNQIRARARVVRNFFGLLKAAGQNTRAIELIEESLQQTLADPNSTMLDKALMQKSVVRSLTEAGLVDRARDTLEELVDTCQNNRLRTFCAVVFMESGLLNLRTKNEQDVYKALARLEPAIKLARELEDPWTLGCSTLYRAEAHLRLKQYEEADRFAKEALVILLKLGDHSGTSEATVVIAKVLRAHHRNEEALALIEKHQTELPAAWLRQQARVLELKALILQDLERWHDALLARNHQFEVEQQYASEQNSDAISKQFAALGLEVEREKNRALQSENELQKSRLREAQRMLGISGLALLFFVVAIVRSLQARSSRLKMQLILDHINEGILTIDQSLRIEKDYSRHLASLIRTSEDLHHQPALPKILRDARVSPDEISTYENVLRASLGEDTLNWDLNAGNLPRELSFGQDSQRVVQLDWLPILSSKQRVQSVLLSMRDVTERRTLEKAVVQERARADAMGLHLQELAGQPLDLCVRLIDDGHSWLQQHADSCEKATQGASRRDLHTMKGVARSLGLKQLSQACHELETQLEGPLDPNQWQNARQTFERELEIYGKLLASFAADGVKVNSLLIGVFSQVLPEAFDQMTSKGLSWGGITIHDSVEAWPETILMDLYRILPQALSNIIDHGFYLPLQRGLAIEPMRIEVTAECGEGNLRLKVEDNGAGLDLEALRRLAHRLGFTPGPGESWVDVIFLDRASTAENISQTSGRGMGMAAMRKILAERSGGLRLEARKNRRGTCLSMTWPLPFAELPRTAADF